MSVTGRLDRLERMPRHPPRCDACRAWPAWRLIHRAADGREEEQLTPCPVECAACGFRPRPVVVLIPDGV
jgi:hypothetical protein